MKAQQAQIVMIGTEGSGKTVFITCLAKYFEGCGKNGCALEPMSKDTPLYVDKNWRSLANGEWPAATNARDVFNLHWQLRVNGQSNSMEEIYALRVVDSAGHDLRGFFADEAIANIEKLPGTLQPLAEYCREAEIVLIMANLKDLMATDDLERTTANQWAVKYALDYKLAQKPDANCALIFTQADAYQGELTALGSWKAVAEKYLPHVYAAHLSDGKIPILAVSAVNKTRHVMMDGGVTRTVPAKDFGHDGFDSLIDWIARQAKTTTEARQAKEIEEEKHALQTHIAEVDRRISTTNQTIQAKELAARTASWKKAIVPTAAVSALILLLLVSILPRTAVPLPPLNWSFDIKDRGWGENDDIVIQNNNSYPYSSVRVWGGKSTNDIGPWQVDQIPAHSSYTFYRVYNFHEDHRYRCWLSCDEQTGTEMGINWETIICCQLILSGVCYVIFYVVFCEMLKKPATAEEVRQLAELAKYRKSLEQQLENVHCQPQSAATNGGQASAPIPDNAGSGSPPAKPTSGGPALAPAVTGQCEPVPPPIPKSEQPTTQKTVKADPHFTVAAPPSTPATTEAPVGQTAMNWFYVIGKDPFGPVSTGELLRAFSAGELGPAVYVFREGLQGWQRAKDCAELFPQPEPQKR